MLSPNRLETAIYTPFLYGRGAELDALSDISASLASSSRVVPLIEPVKANSKARLTISRLSNAGASSYLVVNPTRGDFTNAALRAPWVASMATELANVSVRPVYRENDTTQMADIAAFLTAHPDRKLGVQLSTSRLPAQGLARLLDGLDYVVFFEPTSSTLRYTAHIPVDRTIDIVECFRVQAPNAMYASVPDEWFSDTHRTWRADGRAGFSDFTVLGTTFSESGGQASAVAAHLTYVDSLSNDLRVKHFVSATRSRGGDAAKILEVAEQIESEIISIPSKYETTHGVGEFRRLHVSRASTNLGTSKRWQIAHHIEAVQARMVP